MKVFGVTGYSNSGKTTLLEALIPRFVARGLTVSLIKHTHHGFDVDRPGKDSYRLREAGCSEVMLVSDRRWVLMHEMRGVPEPGLDEQLQRLTPCDLVLVEGFKSSSIPKIEVYRAANGKPMLWSTRPEHIVAIAADAPVDVPLPQFDINDHGSVMNFILQHQGLR